MSSRNKVQELCVFALYQYLFYYSYEQRPSLKEIIESVFGCSSKECDAFAKECAHNFVEEECTICGKEELNRQ